MDTFEERVERAQGATTLGDLAVLLEDLPAETAIARREGRLAENVTTGVPTWPGVRPFEERKILAAHWQAVGDNVRDIIVPTLDRAGYTLVQADDKNFVFAFRYRPVWTKFVAVFAFPLGLLALAHTEEDRITIRLGRAPGNRTRVLVYGRAPRSIRRAFASLSD